MVKILTFLLMVVPTYGIACQNKVDMLAKNIYFEARGEGRHGMRLVADVTLNRVNNDDFPDTICAVVMQKGQFTWNKKSKPTNQEKWELALDVANSAIKGGRRTRIFFTSSEENRHLGRIEAEK